ncbi:MAG: hypothetical protein SFU25_09645 [Candidatus Caenarcaniphilales bacterium]|nr:hypothetical protein [Candidatus Caenarcaniphilales bacterium]
MAINSKSTKNEILKAYQTLEKEKKALEQQLSQTQRALNQAQSEAQKVNTIIAQPSNQNSPQPTVSPSLQTIAGILLNFSKIEEGLSPAISEISAQLTLEAEKLAELLKQNQEKTEHLKTLYNLEVSEDLLDKLLDDYEKAEDDFEQSSKLSDQNQADEWNNLQKAWRKEQQKQEKTRQERTDTISKTQRREYQEYQYDIEYGRKVEWDNYEQKKKQLQTELDEIRELKINEWNEQEKLIKDRELEFEKYKSEFEQLPAKLEKEIKKAEAEGKAIIEKDAKVKADLISKEVESQKRMYELKTQTLQTLIDSRKVQIEGLSKQLESAYKQAQDLAVKAIEGSSNLDKFNAVKEIANELAKNQPKTK